MLTHWAVLLDQLRYSNPTAYATLRSCADALATAKPLEQRKVMSVALDSLLASAGVVVGVGVPVVDPVVST